MCGNPNGYGTSTLMAVAPPVAPSDPPRQRAEQTRGDPQGDENLMGQGINNDVDSQRVGNSFRVLVEILFIFALTLPTISDIVVVTK